MRMNQEVLRHTRQVLAHSLRLLPERAGSTKAPQVAASSLEAASRPLLLAEKVPALPAEPPLGPVAIVALPDEGGGPAPGTGIGGRIARHPAELARDRRLRRIDELALLLEGEPLHLMEYDIQHPVPVSSMSMCGNIHLRAGAGHYCVNGGLTETSIIRRRMRSGCLHNTACLWRQGHWSYRQTLRSCT